MPLNYANPKARQPEVLGKPFLTAVMDSLDKYKSARAKLTKANIQYNIMVDASLTDNRVTGLEVWDDELTIQNTAARIAAILPGYNITIVVDNIYIN